MRFYNKVKIAISVCIWYYRFDIGLYMVLSVCIWYYRFGINVMLYIVAVKVTWITYTVILIDE